jgi:hypothetical protein
MWLAADVMCPELTESVDHYRTCSEAGRRRPHARHPQGDCQPYAGPGYDLASGCRTIDAAKFVRALIEDEGADD